MSSDASRLPLGVLGPLTAGPGSAPLGDGPVARLCCRLLAAGGRSLSAEQLRADVWADAPTSPSIVRVTVHRLRATLGDGPDGARRVERLPSGGWVLNRALVDLDADRFEALVDEAAGREPPVALATLDRALTLWRGRPFEGLEDDEWLWPEMQRLGELREKAVDTRAEALLATRSPDDVIPSLAELAAAAPTRERRTAVLMVALHRAGRSADAVAAFRRHEAALADELGSAPSASIRRLDLRIREHDAELTLTARPERFAEADPSISAGRAARYLARTGAATEAARQADRAVDLAVSETGRATALALRAEIAAAQGRLADAAEDLAKAGAAARGLGDGALLARIALARFGRGIGGSAAESEDLLAALLEPLTLLGAQRPERVELLCAAMFVLLHSTGSADAHRLYQEAEALARNLDSPQATILAELGRAVTDGVRGEGPAVRLRWCQRALERAEQIEDPRLELAARYLELQLQMEAGDLQAIGAGLDRFEQVGRESLLPFAATRPSLVRAALALARGEAAEAQRHIDATFEIATLFGVGSALTGALTQQAMVLLESARFDELVGLLADATSPSATARLAIVALSTALAGQADRSRAALDQWLDQADGEVDSPSFPVMACLAVEAGALCGHRAGPDFALPHLEPLSGRFAAVGMATLTLGPIDRYLALGHQSAGRWADAVDRAEAAFHQATVAGASVWEARCALDLARLLDLDPGGAGAARARQLRAAAAASPAAAGSALLALQLQQVAPV